MIEFILINDSKEEKRHNKELIEKEMMNYDYEYQVVEEETKHSTFKVYIIDDSTRKRDAIKQIKEIRKKDWVSMILITTIERNIADILSLHCMPVDIILKDREYDKYLIRGIRNSIHNLHERPNQLRFEYKKSIYHIPLDNIVYIEKCKEEKNCTIHTEKENYYITRSIHQLEEELKENFVKVNRSQLVHRDAILQFNRKDNKITLNKLEIQIEVSRERKKEIIDFLRNVE